VPPDQPDRGCVERLVTRRGELRAQHDTGGVGMTPQQPGTDGIAEALTQPEHRLVRRVGCDAQRVGQLRGLESVPQVQIQQARVTLTQRRRRCPDEIALRSACRLTLGA
jgi:hypothetical protein